MLVLASEKRFSLFERMKVETEYLPSVSVDLDLESSRPTCPVVYDMFDTTLAVHWRHVDCPSKLGCHQ